MSRLWDLVWTRPEVDPTLLAEAVELELENGSRPDYRTRILISDSVKALELKWGQERYQKWLQQSKVADRIEAIRSENLEVGFSRLKESLVDRTSPNDIKSYLRELSQGVRERTRLEIGGSVSLILQDYLNRATTDIDIVDEVPAALRSQHKLLEKLQQRYKLLLTHFQSHYLPEGWKQRLEFIETIGSIDVYVINIYDAFVGKLFSGRDKDLDDLRGIYHYLDQKRLEDHVIRYGQKLASDPKLLPNAEKNWYILFGTDLPISGSSE